MTKAQLQQLVDRLETEVLMLRNGMEGVDQASARDACRDRDTALREVEYWKLHAERMRRGAEALNRAVSALVISEAELDALCRR